MKLQLFNSVTKSKQEFKPLKHESVSMYVCGPTVYSAPHLGNGLSIVVFDILYRLLSHIYGSDKVKYVRNITDVDDKINDEAKRRGISIHQLTHEVTKVFHENTDSLGCLAPTIEPKVTDHIKEIIEIIELLLANGFAYQSENHVYFEVKKFAGYGKLAGRNLDELLEGVRIDVDKAKRDAADFVLWKPETNNSDPSAVFASPWGKGRPGWHIECSAMSHKYLGENFDIHGGGVDLVFPHHTNEIAQSCAAFKGSNYANFWVHNGFLTVEGEKMSKSLGNFVTIEDLLKEGIHGEVIRYHLASTHYRKPMDWNKKSVEDAKKALDNFYRVLEVLDEDDRDEGKISPEFIEALLDDLNTPNAYAVLHMLAKESHKANDMATKKNFAKTLKASANLIGLLRLTPAEWFKQENSDYSKVKIDELVAKRVAAKKAKNWALADELRREIEEMNITLEDKADGTTIWRRH